jgi:hypothetical protein
MSERNGTADVAAPAVNEELKKHEDETDNNQVFILGYGATIYLR